jgi:hypothetical protein
VRSGRYDDAALRRLSLIARSSRPVEVALEVSSGPWPGFNGVQALALAGDVLYRLQTSRFALRPNAILDVVPVESVSDVAWTVGPLGQLGRLRFRFEGKRRSYISRWSEGYDLAQAIKAA